MTTNISSRAAMAQTYGWEYAPHDSLGYYFNFEDIDGVYWVDLAKRSRNVVYYVGIVYFITIFGLQRWMKNRPAYELKMPLFWWNATLGVFSVMGWLRVLPSFLYVMSTENGFYNSICAKKYLDVPVTFWGLLFALSKFWELGDTVFIVLRKKPLVFIQYYHHLIMMAGTWIIAPMLEPVGRWYPVLNFGVHSFMYNYFALRAIGVRVPTIVTNFITTIQFLQMIIGATVNLLSTIYFYQGHDCYRNPTSVNFTLSVHVTFILLFGKLFYDSVIKKGRAKRNMTEKTKKID